ncbi:hypothetical protein SAMN05428995_103347 [Loktanella sp. DSM 29012]|uniref:hypothetical protein n=1 Tax=Loktanella sp. DSM 29012 TaxID=1881056 RepID=UPI0008B2C098|nr:hypothetical protein [Loktanella sp. DSM 29012]SEQ24631.1 hypothetical protein SAMN05428995_103347 [Loktanella sp. DSM 29012]
MKSSAAIAAALYAVASTTASAQGITGGQLGIEYNAPIDGSDFGGTTYSGGIEYGINRSYALSLNAAGYRPDNFDTDATNVTLHGTYHFDDFSSAGIFVSHDDLDDESITLVGIEGGTDIYGGDLTTYLARSNDDDVTVIGFAGEYAIRDAISVIGDLDYADLDGGSISQFGIGAAYDLNGGPTFYAKIGNARYDDGTIDESAGFVSIGVDVAFGAERGTTFDTRSIFDILPGF